MAAQYGQLSEYHPDTEEIASYLERVEVFIVANEVAEERQAAVFLSVVGARTFALIRDLVSPAKPSAKTFQELCDVLRAHFEPKPIVIAERFYFHSRNQGSTETIAEFLAELRKLATHCQFGEQLNEALRDRLVCGLRNSAIQKRLLSEADLDLPKALRISQSIEAADANVRKLQVQEGESADVHYTHQKPCYRCGGTDHAAGACRFKQAECHKCGKRGHIARVCRSPSRKRSTPSSGHASTDTRRHAPRSEGTTFTVRGGDLGGDETMSDQSPDGGFPVYTLGSPSPNPITLTLDVNGQRLPMQLDTGAAVSLISTRTHKRLFPRCPLAKTSITLSTYTGERMNVAGRLQVKVRYGQQCVYLPLYIVEGGGPTLLGRSWLNEIRLDWGSMLGGFCGCWPAHLECPGSQWSHSPVVKRVVALPSSHSRL